jgi:outer membrane lipoprotein-sorting protein
VRHLKLFSIVSRYLPVITLIIIISHTQAKSSNQQDLIKSKIENFFINLHTLEADFIQVSPSGVVSNGKLFLDLPGKLRLDYIKPNNLLITCKGFWIVVQDRNLKSTNNIPLSQTPFSILLDKKIDFDNEKFIFNFKQKLGIISVKIKIAKNDQIGELVMEFSDNPFILKKWTIKDILGDETTVLIQNAKLGNSLPFRLFFPEDFLELENN